MHIKLSKGGIYSQSLLCDVEDAFIRRRINLQLLLQAEEGVDDHHLFLAGDL